MATTYTPNYNLGKQEDSNDIFDMSVITGNMDTIDTEMKRNADSIAGVQQDIGGMIPILNQILQGVNSVKRGIGDTNAIIEEILTGEADFAVHEVRFIDYDGTVLETYSPDEFASLTEMPANPTHTGLTAQGWNWSLSDAKAYAVKYKSLDIGQMYVTDDGKTRIYISLSEGRTSPVLQLYLNANSELDIDWGDGGTHSTFTSGSAGYKNERHVYPTPGDYVIAITVVNGGFILESSTTTNVSSILWNGNNSTSSPDKAYNNAIQKIEIGTGVTSIGKNTFNGCNSLSSVTIPDSVTSISNGAFFGCFSLTSITLPNTLTSINNYAFDSCYSLSSITLPSSVTSIGSGAFNGCNSLSSVTIPDTVTSIGDNAFNGCSSLSSITIPDGVITIGSGAFQSCSSLSSITLPNTLTSIGQNTFNNCYSLSSVTISDSVTSISNGAFFGCSSLSSVTIPEGVTRIGVSAFQNCSSLSSVTIPDTVTSIGQQVFYGCYSLSSITIPDGVTSIGQQAFQYCSYMSYIKFESTTPPTVSSSNAWGGVSTSTRILVPINTYEVYTTATNYPSSSTYKYFVYGTYNAGDTLPTTTTDNYNLTWYASMDDAASQTNPISVGNGNEIYATCTPVT